MSTAARMHYSHDLYLHALADSGIKLEYWAGVIYAMAGGTPEHGALAAKIIGLLESRLPPGCKTFSSDVKVRIAAADVTVFPDAFIVCGKIQRAVDDALAIANPGLIIEVTSPSTKEYDRGDKLKAYKLLKSVQAIWLIAHDAVRVTSVERQAKSWKTIEHGKGDALTLTSPALTIDVDAIYRALDGF
jgi:Uma2 family endonuclease